MAPDALAGVAQLTFRQTASVSLATVSQLRVEVRAISALSH
jgi:hypothetical protein